MQIILVQDEIMAALEQYVRNQITVKENQKIEIDLKAGRGENGFSATLDIQPANNGITINTADFIPIAPASASAEVLTMKTKITYNADDQAAPTPELSEEDSKPTGSIFGFAKSMSTE